MTDTRLPEQWLGDPTLDALSDAALRVHWNALIWSVKYGMDGLLLRTALRLLHPEGARPEAVEELLAAGLWRRRGDDFEIVGFLDSQSSAQEVERQKARNRAKTKAWRQREAQAAASSSASSSEVLTDAVTGVVTGHVTRNVTGVVGQDRTGKGSKTGERTKSTQAREPKQEAPAEEPRAAVSAPAPVGRDGWPLPEPPCSECGDRIGSDRTSAGRTTCGPCDAGTLGLPQSGAW